MPTTLEARARMNSQHTALRFCGIMLLVAANSSPTYAIRNSSVHHRLKSWATRLRLAMRAAAAPAAREKWSAEETAS